VHTSYENTKVFPAKLVIVVAGILLIVPVFIDESLVVITFKSLKNNVEFIVFPTLPILS